MSTPDKDLEVLDKLLEETAADPGVAEIQDRAHDTGHVDQELLAKFGAGALEAEESTNIRRHLLFCDECTKLVLGRGGEVEDEDEPSPASAPAPIPTGSPRLFPLFLFAVIGIAAIAVLVLIDPPPDPVPTLRRASLHSLIRGEQRDLSVQPGERIAVSLAVDHAERLFVYVFALTPDGAWHVLEPRTASALATDFTGEVWLPPGSDPRAEQRTSWQLAELARVRPAEHVGLYVFLASDRIPVFEGDQLIAATLPLLEKDFLPADGRYDREHMEEVGVRLETMRVADIVVTLAVRVEPL